MEKLGFKLQFFWGKPPTHAGVELGRASLHFSQGEPDTNGFWIYLSVDDVDP